MGIFIIFALSFAFLLILLYLLDRKTKNSFESKGVPYLTNGTLRFIKNAFQQVGFVDSFTIIYNQLKVSNIKLAGGMDFNQAVIVICDPDIIKNVLVKDFAHFGDRRILVFPKQDYLLRKMLIALKGDQWKALRSKLSPTFTTGKIKRQFSFFDQSGKKLVKFVEQEMHDGGVGEMDLSVGYSKFTMDIIASAVCGMDSQAFDQKEQSIFEKMGMKLQLQFGTASQIVKIFLMFLAPKLTDILGLSLFDMEMQDFFSFHIKSSINQRKTESGKRNDFLQLMLDAREDKIKVDENELDNFEKDAILSDGNAKVSSGDILDDDGIVANAVLFILAGFDTTQSLLLFCAYALALNQTVQDKLREEVDAVLEENGGEFTYESLNKMNYLDMVINETLRYYPPAGMTDRNVTQDYKIPGTDYILKKGGAIQIPIAGLHHDPEYWAEPEKFDPERWSPENKANINQYAYLPFGAGPRNCIGMRFALAEVKVAISHLVHNFKIEPSKKTMIPMKYSNTNSLKPVDGMFLALNKIH